MNTRPLPTVFAVPLDTSDHRPQVPRPWPRFMTARVAADYANTSPWTIRRNVAPCGRRGRSFVYTIESVERWMRGTALVAPDSSEPPVLTHVRASQAGSLARIREAASRRRNIATEDERTAVAADRPHVAA